MHALKIYTFRDNVFKKTPVIINIDCISQIRPSTSNGNQCYEILFGTNIVNVAPEDMQPVWDALGMRL